MILGGNVFPQNVNHIIFQSGFLAEALEILHLTYTHLKILQTGMKQGFDYHMNHFRIRINGVVTDKLRTELGNFL